MNEYLVSLSDTNEDLFWEWIARADRESDAVLKVYNEITKYPERMPVYNFGIMETFGFANVDHMTEISEGLFV